METTNTKTEQLNNLSTDLKRALALRKFEGVDYFFWQDIPYEGTLADAQKQFSDLDTESKESGFDEFVISNFVEIEEFDNEPFDYGDKEYYVLTDSEADDVWESELDDYISHVIMPEIPGYLQIYFDEERWKEDARYDGRGHSIGRYDGNENEETIGDETFYIYRIN